MDFSSFVDVLINILNSVGYLIIGLATVVFMYGLVTYIYYSDNESKRKESTQYITYGIIGLFVMVSVWGLVYIITNTFGFDFAIPQLI